MAAPQGDATMEETTKTCTKCGETKPLEQFHKRPRNKLDREAHCKACHNELARQWRLRNPEKVVASGLRYRERFKKPKPPSALETGVKVCSRCGIEKPIEAFDKNSRSRHGVQSACKTCRRLHAPYDPARERERYRRRSTNPEYRERRRAYGRDWRMQARFGITVAEWETIFDAQERVCAICKSPTPRGANWHTDHCHTNGHVRGVLCQPCNLGLGLFSDSQETLKAAQAYLATTGLPTED